MNLTARLVITTFLAPLMPWTAYWLFFAGANIPSIILGEKLYHLINPSLIWAATLVSAVAALAGILLGHARKPKDLM